MNLKSTLLFILLFLCVRINAQNIAFKASVSNNKIELGDAFQISFSINNASGIQKFTPPNFNNFNVLSGPNQSSSFSTINGSSSSTMSLSYVLQAKKSGKFNIAGASAIIEGKNLSTNSCVIEVVNATTNGQARYHNKSPQNQPYFNEEDNGFAQNPFTNNGQPNTQRIKKPRPQTPITAENLKKKVFAKLDVDKSQAYIGEQVLASYNIYTQIPCEIDVKKINTPEGFWTHDFTDVINPHESERVTINGQDYRKYTLRKTALFPTKAGKLYIPPMQFGGYAQVQTAGATRGSIIEEILGEVFEEGLVNKIPLDLATDSVTINTLEIPENNKPANFDGNVGTYTLESSIDKTELSTNDAATITFTIRGKGNIKLINTPKLIFDNNVETYEPSIFDTITNNRDEVAGYKVFKYIVQPKTSGDVKIASASFVFFNPNTQKFETLISPEYNLVVSDAKNIKTSSTKSKNGNKDINDIFNDDNMSKHIPNILVENPVYWLGFLLPLALLGLIIYKRKKTNKLETTKNNFQIPTNNIENTSKEKLRVAKEMLQANNKNGFYNQVSQAVWMYAAEKLNIPLSELNNSNIKNIMQTKGVDENVQNQFIDITQQCQQALYGQAASTDMQQMYNNANNLLQNMQNKL